MAARNQKVECWAGDTLQISVKLTTSDGRAIQLVDPSAIWGVRKTAKPDSEKLIERAVLNDHFFFETRDDGFTYLVIRLLEADTVGLEPGVYYHEATVFEGPTRATTSTGAFEVFATVNRRAP